MVSAAELLDPAAKNRQLRALAFFQASLASDSRNAIDCLVPVVLLALDGKDQAQFDVSEISIAIKDMFPQLELPLYMINEIVPKLVSRDALRYDQATHLYIVNSRTIKTKLETTQVDFDKKTISDLEESLTDFALSRGVERPMASDTWEQALIDFFAADREEPERKTAKISGSIITNPEHIDHTIVASFLRKAEREAPHLLRAAASLYYAFITYDFFRDLGSTGNKSDYANLSVFYDSTVLMRILGTSGSLLKTATLQMHEALQDLGCRIYYFDHTYNEVQANLERVVENERQGRSIYPETQEALRSGEISIGRVAAIARAIDTELGALGITQHSASYETTRKKDEFQIDESLFTEKLDNGSPNYDEFTRSKDSHSLALVIRLRSGHNSRDVGKSRFIFITHNVRFSSVARRFCRDNGVSPAYAIPPVLTLGQMTTLSWLASDKPYEEEEVTKELLANCFRAVLPSERWEEEFWSALSGMKEGADHDKMLQDVIYVDTARRIALERSFGHPSLVRKVVDGELLRRANTEREREVESAHADGAAKGESIARAEMRKNAEAYAERISGYVSESVKFAVLIVAVSLFILSFFSEYFKSSYILIPSMVVSIFLGIVTAAEFFGFPIAKPVFLPVRRFVRALILTMRPYC